MAGHLHTDALHIFVFATGTFLVGHAMRIIGSYVGTRINPTAGAAIGAFYSAPASN